MNSMSDQPQVQPLNLPALVAKQAVAAPDSLALQAGAEAMTYGELNRRANQLAHHLKNLGVGSDKVVGLHLDRSPSQVMAALAVLKAGGAYLPLDPAVPSERLEFMLRDSGATVLVTRSTGAASLAAGNWRVVNLDTDGAKISGNSKEDLVVDWKPEDLAYVIFTSGSTGRPKGVEITHAGLANLISWHRRVFEITSADRASHSAGLSFDAAVWEVWPYLAVGASLHIPDNELRNNPQALRDWLVQEKITITFLATVMAEAVLQLSWPSHTALRYLLTGADRLTRRPSAKLPFKLVNNYGPTECTVVATSGTVAPQESRSDVPSIGRAIDNTDLHILDEHMKPVVPGTAGELFVAGPSLARGYRNHPELTAEKFVTHPLRAGERLYRTGDRVRQLPDGDLEFLGRIDEQIKMRGYRIEPGEIAAVLNSYPGVASSSVITRDDAGETRLVAYVVPAGGAQLTATGLRTQLQKQLPDYMVPSAFVELATMPVNFSGKIDRSALPAPAVGNLLPDEEFVAPQGIVEQRLAEIIASLLHVERVGARDNFFLMGGHSLLGTQLLTRISSTFGVDLSLLGLFDHPTLSEMSGEIERLILEKIGPMSDDVDQPLSETA